MKTTFIYLLKDPRNNFIRYIGKSNNPKLRLYGHCNKSNLNNSYKSRWIKVLKAFNLKPILEIIEEIPIKEWRTRERYWIKYYLSIGYKLTNTTDGGDGLTNGNHQSFKKGRKPWNNGTKEKVIQRECPECGIVFITKSNNTKKTYCSIKCGLKPRSRKPSLIKDRICRECRDLYKPHSNNTKRKYCSRRCASRNAKKNRGYIKPWNKGTIKERICRNCGSIFIPKSNSSKQSSCSKKCGNESKEYNKNSAGNGFKKGYISWNSGTAKEIKLIVCKYCKKSFKPQRSSCNSKYCSVKCVRGCKSKRVLQYTLKNEFIKEYINANQAAKDIGCSNSSIYIVLTGKRNDSVGFKWKRK